MQQLAFARWGPGLDQCSEVLVPAKILSGSGTVPILNGVNQSVPMWNPDSLRDLTSRLRCVVLRLFPDGAAPNRLVMTHL